MWQFRYKLPTTIIVPKLTQTGKSLCNKLELLKVLGLPDVSYPFHDKTVTVTKCGRICLGNQKIHFSTVFAGHDVGLRQVEDDVWLVSFMDYDMAYFDMESHKVSALENPFGPKVLG